MAEGQMMYSTYRAEVIDPMLGLSALDSMIQAPVQSRAVPDADVPVVIPDSLVAVQAYVMWEQAGKPQVSLAHSCRWTLPCCVVLSLGVLGPPPHPSAAMCVLHVSVLQLPCMCVCVCAACDCGHTLHHCLCLSVACVSGMCVGPGCPSTTGVVMS